MYPRHDVNVSTWDTRCLRCKTLLFSERLCFSSETSVERTFYYFKEQISITIKKVKVFQEISCEKSKIIKRTIIEDKRNKVFNLFPGKLKAVLHRIWCNLQFYSRAKETDKAQGSEIEFPWRRMPLASELIRLPFHCLMSLQECCGISLRGKQHTFIYSPVWKRQTFGDKSLAGKDVRWFQPYSSSLSKRTEFPSASLAHKSRCSTARYQARWAHM